jgi:hypothetical protein
MYDPDNEYFYKKIFRDIAQGYSLTKFDGKDVYIKHLSMHDYIDTADQEKLLLEKAVKRGIPRKDAALKSAIEEGYWTEEDENFIYSQKIFVENLNKSKAHLLLKSERDQHQKIIDEEGGKLSDKLVEKNEITGSSAEDYAKSQVNDYYILSSLFNDSQLNSPFYSKDEFAELTRTELSKVILVNNSHAGAFAEEHIQKMVLEDFFFPYMFLAEKPTELFGLPAVGLTSFQVTTLLFARIFKNIFENTENIPDAIRKNPEALIEFSSNTSNKQKAMENLEKDGVSTVFGATESDYEQMGVRKGDVSRGGQSLHQAAKKKGGSLNMADLMDLS